MHLGTHHRGFTLIELMIVIAIVGILASIAMPEYAKYADRSRFSEVILETTQFKKAAEVAVQMGHAIGDLNSGSYGLPDVINNADAVSKYISSVSIVNGNIRAEAVSDLYSAVYQIDGNPSAGSIQWELNHDESTCLNYGFCSPH